MSEPWDSMVRDAGYDPKTSEGRQMAAEIKAREHYAWAEGERERSMEREIDQYERDEAARAAAKERGGGDE